MILGLELEHLYKILSTKMDLLEGNLQKLQHLHLKLGYEQLLVSLSELKIIKKNGVLLEIATYHHVMSIGRNIQSKGEMTMMLFVLTKNQIT